MQEDGPAKGRLCKLPAWLQVICLPLTLMCYLIKKLNLFCRAVLSNELLTRDVLTEKAKTKQENASFFPQFHQLKKV